MNTAPLLEAHALTVETPGGRALVRELDLHLGRERVAVVGRNGVGKSTLLDVLAGRQEPARGQVVRRGRHLLVPQHLGGDVDRRRQPRRTAAATPGDGARRASRPVAARRADAGSGCRRHGLAGGRWSAWRDGLLVVSHDRRVAARLRPVLRRGRVGLPPRGGTFDHCWPSWSGSARTPTPLPGRAQPPGRPGGAQRDLRRRRQRKKNVGRIRELKRCPARIKLNDKRSYKQESQGKRAVLQRDANRRRARRPRPRAGRCASICRWNWRCRVAGGPPRR